MDKKLRLIVGLGNPGERYQNTYHNIGSSFVDYLGKKYASLRKMDWQLKKSCFPYIKIKTLVLLKPDVFMNDSGSALKIGLKYFNIKPENLLIIHDDSDINMGEYKFSFGRGSAGHKGTESIIKSLKTKNFWRLRIGIRPLKDIKRIKAGDLVLKKIGEKETEIFKKVFKSINNSREWLG